MATRPPPRLCPHRKICFCWETSCRQLKIRSTTRYPAGPAGSCWCSPAQRPSCTSPTPVRHFSVSGQIPKTADQMLRGLPACGKVPAAASAACLTLLEQNISQGKTQEKGNVGALEACSLTGARSLDAGRVCSQIQLVNWVSALHHQHHSPLVAANAPGMPCDHASISGSNVTLHVSCDNHRLGSLETTLSIDKGIP